MVKVVTKVEIHADWMIACGMGNRAVTVPVTQTQGTNSTELINRMYYVTMPDGYPWLVAANRCRIVETREEN